MPKIKNKTVTQSQADVYKVLREVGPVADHALVPLAQHMAAVHQSSSGIRTRRKELVELGLAKKVRTTSTGSGRQAAVYKAC